MPPCRPRRYSCTDRLLSAASRHPSSYPSHPPRTSSAGLSTRRRSTGSGALPHVTRANPHACHRHRQRALRTQARFSIVDRPDGHRPGLYSRRRVDEHQDGRKHNSSHPPEKTFSLHILQVRLAHGSLKETSPQAAQCEFSHRPTSKQRVLHPGRTVGSAFRCRPLRVRMDGPSCATFDRASLGPTLSGWHRVTAPTPIVRAATPSWRRLAGCAPTVPGSGRRLVGMGARGPSPRRPRSKPPLLAALEAGPYVPCLPSVSPAPEASFARTSTA